MSTSNDVFQIMVADADKAPAAPGTTIESLEDGQLGVFDAHTHLAIDGTSPVRDFYIGVGIDADGDGEVDMVDKSSGQLIQARNISAYAFRPHTAAVPMQVEITDYRVKCDQDYGIKLEFRNQEIYDHQGFNQYAKTYVVRSGCCDGCDDDCEPGNVNDLTQKLVREIRFDADTLVTAEPIASQPLTVLTHGTSKAYAAGDVVTDEDLQVLVDFNEAQDTEDTKVSTGIRLTTKPSSIRRFSSINTRYSSPRGTIIIPSLIHGFNCTGKTEVIEKGAFEEGNGYDLKQREYVAAGYSASGPYRTHSNTGLAKEIDYRVDGSAKYDIVALAYDQFSQSGWLDYRNSLATEIGFPTTQGGSTVARTGLITILDRIVTPFGYDPLSDDAARASNDPEVSEPTEDAPDQDLDGIS